MQILRTILAQISNLVRIDGVEYLKGIWIVLINQ